MYFLRCLKEIYHFFVSVDHLASLYLLFLSIAGDLDLFLGVDCPLLGLRLVILRVAELVCRGPPLPNRGEEGAEAQADRGRKWVARWTRGST